MHKFTESCKTLQTQTQKEKEKGNHIKQKQFDLKHYNISLFLGNKDDTCQGYQVWPPAY